MKNPAAVELGRLGGKRGGPARARTLSPERKTEIARKAANARWSKEKMKKYGNRNYPVTAHLTAGEYQALELHCEKWGVEMGDAIREAIDLLHIIHSKAFESYPEGIAKRLATELEAARDKRFVTGNI